MKIIPCKHDSFFRVSNEKVDSLLEVKFDGDVLLEGKKVGNSKKLAKALTEYGKTLQEYNLLMGNKLK